MSRQCRVNYKIRLIQLLAAAVIVVAVFGAIRVHADSKDVTCSSQEFVYKMIKVEQGDSLWDIAEVWSGSTSDDIRTYIKNLKEMNNLPGDMIKDGQVLMIYCGQSMADIDTNINE